MENLTKKLPFLNQRWFQFLRFLTRHFFEDNCQQKAASLTYTTMLSIVPILTVLLMILSSVPALSSVRAQIYEVIYSNLLPRSSMQVSEYINSFAEKSSNLTIIGALILFLTTILTLTTIERAFNQIWRVENRSGGIKSMMRYWTIVTMGPLVLGTAFIASSTVQSLSFLNRQIAGYGIDWSFWVQAVSIGITLAGFIGMYWFIPKARVPAKNAAIAGIFVAIVFELMKYLFGTVMANFTSYEAIYGAFAALPIFLLWIFLSWNLILLGVEISYTLTIFETEEVYPRHPLLSLLDMLNLVYTHHLKGDAVSEQALRNVLGRKELPKWYTYINYLQDSNLITMTEDDDYVLKRDLSKMTLWDFYRTLPYPLPIKDEFDEMTTEDQKPWLSLLVARFEDTESYAKRQLNLPLSTVFADSEPRKKADSNEKITLKDHKNTLFRKTKTPSGTSSSNHDSNLEKSPHFDPATYDKESDVEYDEHNNEILIPMDANEGHDTHHSETETARRDDHRRSIITEADNPQPYQPNKES
ncbi:YihY/virulence factor BrkB family protein [Psychrobacter alimentarius]|uniref:YihY/virulence factor BrkB family protein n=1 Tax=Psychrobacter alimentarius TaxID=261164 RepID=UPI0019198302|nr:YhjD/YihY/BrkB family envelope integrity protein [Psychrobacter alimentarius]